MCRYRNLRNKTLLKQRHIIRAPIEKNFNNNDYVNRRKKLNKERLVL